MSQFTDAIEKRLEGYTHISTGVCPGCPACAKREGLSVDEMNEALERGDTVDSYFSWAPCESCGSRLGGDREYLHGICSVSRELIHFGGACVDCVRFHANGDEPEAWEE